MKYYIKLHRPDREPLYLTRALQIGFYLVEEQFATDLYLTHAPLDAMVTAERLMAVTFPEYSRREYKIEAVRI